MVQLYKIYTHVDQDIHENVKCEVIALVYNFFDDFLRVR